MTVASLVLITSDATFGALFRAAVEPLAPLTCRTVVAPGEALAAVREVSPHHVLLDMDGQSQPELGMLVRKLALVRPVGIVVTGAQAGPASAAAAVALRGPGVRYLAKPSTGAGLDLVDTAGARPFLDALLGLLGVEAA